jgi:hypothetical protein
VGIKAKTPQSLDITGLLSFKKAFGNVSATSELFIDKELTDFLSQLAFLLWRDSIFINHAKCSKILG